MLSQAPNRVIFKLVDPADLSWLRESGFSREEIDIVKTLPHGKAAVIAVSRTACYQNFFCHEANKERWRKNWPKDRLLPKF